MKVRVKSERQSFLPFTFHLHFHFSSYLEEPEIADGGAASTSRLARFQLSNHVFVDLNLAFCFKRCCTELM